MSQEEKELYEFGPFRLDIGEHVFERSDGVKDGSLPEKAFQTLCFLVRNHGRLISKQELLDHVWPDSFVEENNLDKSIHAIRNALGEQRGEQKYIETVRKHGYRFVADVRRIETGGNGFVEYPEDVFENGEISIVERPIKEKSERHGWPIFAGLTVAGLLVLILAFLPFNYGTGDTAPVDSIAVMPFVNETGNADLEYLSDGMTESLINRLSRVPNLTVKARNTVFLYKGESSDPRRIGNRLSVRAVLFGRVIQRGEMLAVLLELADTGTGDRIWGYEYSRRQSDIVALQSEIARDITEKLQAKLSRADETKLAKNYTENSEAYLLYLKGRFHWNTRRTPKDFEKAIEYFEQAIAVDPNYSIAYAGLSDAYLGLSGFDARPPREMMPKVRDYALKALALDDQLAEAHAALGSVLFYGDLDFAGAEREYKRAIELNPRYPTAHHFYATLLRSLGRHDEALAENRLALEIDPLSLVANAHYGINLTLARRYDEAIEQFKRTLDLDPGFAWASHNLGIAYELKGDHAEAVEAFAKYEELVGNDENAAMIRESFSNGGWQQFLRVAGPKLGMAGLPLRYPATFYAALGEKNKAISSLNEAYENRQYHVVLLKVDPRLDPLRDDPRFVDLLRRVGFPE